MERIDKLLASGDNGPGTATALRAAVVKKSGDQEGQTDGSRRDEEEQGEEKKEEEILYRNIMSPQWGSVLLIGLLIAAYIKSYMLVALVFSAAISTILGSSGKERKPNQRRRAANPDDDFDDEEDDEGREVQEEYETEAGLLLSQWLRTKMSPAEARNNTGPAKKIRELQRKAPQPTTTKGTKKGGNGPTPKVKRL